MLGDTQKKGLLIVFSAPSGCGKDTVLARLEKEADFRRSISMTTRQMRDGETDGVDYYFVTQDYFLKKLEQGQILEYTNYNGNYYGTPKSAIDDWLKKGETVILKIEVEGAENIKKLYPDSIGIFLIPPSIKILEQRLRNRSSETEDEVQSRMTIARNELKHAVNYDYIVVNDLLDDAIEDIKSIIRSEKHKTERSKNIIREVINNA